MCDLPGYQSVMRLSKSPMYKFGEITSNWLDVTYACYLVQIDIGIGNNFWADLVTDVLSRVKPGHGYFRNLTKLVKYGILEKSNIPKGVNGTEPVYKLRDHIGVALALHALGYPISL